MATGDRVVTFQGHHSYIVSIAKLCKENGLFTDVTILCDDGKLLAHKIVLAAVSPFLCHVLERESSGGGPTTIVMPDIRREIVQQLLDFLYTGVMKLSQNATFELQQLVLLLQIDPQNVGVDTMTNGMDPDKVDRLSNSVSQYLGIKIARTADISHHKVAPSLSSAPTITKQSPKSSHVKSPPLTNGLLRPGHSHNSVNESPRPGHGHIKTSPGQAKLSSPPTSQHKLQDAKSVKHNKVERSLDPIKISIPSGSIIRSSNDSNSSHHVHHLHPSSQSSSDNSNVINKDKIATRKRPLSEKIDYNEMMADEDISMKRARGGKGRGKNVRGGGKGGGRGSRDGDVLCAICNQFDPNIPPGYSSYGNKTEWIGCDCNRWFHKFCTRLKEVDDSFSCRLVHKSCLPSPSSKAVT